MASPASDVQCSSINFGWDGGDSISPDCARDVAQNKNGQALIASSQGSSQLTSNNVNYPLLWSERHRNFNYVNSEPFCSHEQKISRHCFSGRKLQSPLGISANLTAMHVMCQRINSLWAWATWGWLLSQETKTTMSSLTVCFPNIILGRPWQPVRLAMSANVEGVWNERLCGGQPYTSNFNTWDGQTITKQKWHQAPSVRLQNKLVTLSVNHQNSSWEKKKKKKSNSLQSCEEFRNLPRRTLSSRLMLPRAVGLYSSSSPSSLGVCLMSKGIWCQGEHVGLCRDQVGPDFKGRYSGPPEIIWWCISVPWEN